MKDALFFGVVIIVICAACGSPKPANSQYKPAAFDFEAHRGGRGLMPENTIPAMKHAIDLDVTTLEMDVVISMDNKVVVSHDPWFNELITTTPAGTLMTKSEAEALLLYKMPYESIRRYDVGIKPHPGFPQQQKLNTYKPLLAELIDSVEAYAKGKGRTMRYNIEIKSREGFDGIRHPDPPAFAELLIAVLTDKNVLNRTIIQSFDVRPLQYIHKAHPLIKLSYLVEKTSAPLSEQLDKLGFVPNAYSPNFPLLTKEIVEQSHAKGMVVIPWTVNSLKEMNALVAIGVDGIISDYPDLFKQLRVNK